MKKFIVRFVAVFGILALVGVLAVPCASWAADEVTIMGTVSPDGILMSDDGKEYVIQDDDLGRELMDKGADEKVRVTGAVEEVGGELTITVTEYEEIPTDD